MDNQYEGNTRSRKMNLKKVEGGRAEKGRRGRNSRWKKQNSPVRQVEERGGEGRGQTYSGRKCPDQKTKNSWGHKEEKKKQSQGECPQQTQVLWGLQDRGGYSE